MCPYITSLGTATPPYRFEQDDIANYLVRHNGGNNSIDQRKIRWLFKKTGIQQRYSVLPDFTHQEKDKQLFTSTNGSPPPSTRKRMQQYHQHALPLAKTAIENCLASSNTSSADITHLITVSCTGLYAPGLDVDLIKQLNLPSTIHRTSINYMGCYAAINALKVADNITRAHPSAHVVIISIELCSLHFQEAQDYDNLLATALFGDGAAAALVEPKPSSTNKAFGLSTFYADIIPDSEEDMAWTIGDFGFELTLSATVPQQLKQGLQQLNHHLLPTSTIHQSSPDFFAIHPGGKEILKTCEEELHISPHENRYAYQILEEFGNMSSPTILFILEKIWKSLKSQDHGKKALGASFGPGLTLESMLLTIHYET